MYCTRQYQSQPTAAETTNEESDNQHSDMEEENMSAEEIKEYAKLHFPRAFYYHQMYTPVKTPKAVYFRFSLAFLKYTGSRPITEVKLHRACLVLGWVTARESQVPNTFFFFLPLSF